MREYSKVYPKFWTGTNAQRLRNLGSNHLLIALYCITSQHANMLGIYHLPLYYISYNTSLSLDVVQKCIQDLCEMSFCQYDQDSEYIWVLDMAYDQIEANLSEKDNRVKYIRSLYESFPNDLPFLEEFYNQYHEDFHLNRRNFNLPSKPLPSPFEPPSKPLPSPFGTPSKPLRTPFEAIEQEQEQEKEKEQEQEKEKEKEKEQEKRNSIVVQARHFSRDDISLVFSFWQNEMHHPNAQLDEKRKSLIRKALQMGYSTNDLKKAISGCAATPHNIGDNQQGQRYDGLHVILRDADQIDRFIANFHKPPRPLTKTEKRTQENFRDGHAWLEMKVNEMTPEEQEALFAEQAELRKLMFGFDERPDNSNSTIIDQYGEQTDE